MGHAVDGFELKYTSRRSWKAERSERGKAIDVIPVTWADAWNAADGLLEVYFQDPNEMEVALQNREPFIVALAAAKHPTARPREFLEFRGIYEVVATGESNGEDGIHTTVRRRVVAGK
jgi:hypothetical protein